jgi:hypothetical protein
MPTCALRTTDSGRPDHRQLAWPRFPTDKLRQSRLGPFRVDRETSLARPNRQRGAGRSALVQALAERQLAVRARWPRGLWRRHKTRPDVHATLMARSNRDRRLSTAGPQVSRTHSRRLCFWRNSGKLAIGARHLQCRQRGTRRRGWCRVVVLPGRHRARRDRHRNSRATCSSYRRSTRHRRWLFGAAGVRPPCRTSRQARRRSGRERLVVLVEREDEVVAPSREDSSLVSKLNTCLPMAINAQRGQRPDRMYARVALSSEGWISGL